MNRFFVFMLFVNGISNSFTQNLRTFHNIDGNQITISGFSSGGTFSQQLQFSYPELFQGIAVFSHTFYRCGPPNGVQDDFDRVCTLLENTPESQLYDPERVHNDIRDYEKRGYIGRTSSLKNKKLYVFSGLRNSLFSPAMSLNILRVYERYIKNPQAIRTRVLDAGLVMPTNNHSAPPCTANVESGIDFNANCHFSGAYEALNFLLENRCNKEPRAGERIALQPLREFNQEEFIAGISKHNMDKTGYFYVPRGCQVQGRTKCPLHIFFHGCLNGREFFNDGFIKGSGYLEVAEKNDIIMIFPQAVSSQPQNSIGCWDTYGLSGVLFATKEGDQVKVVKRILDRAIGTHGPSNGDSPHQRPSNGWSQSKAVNLRK